MVVGRGSKALLILAATIVVLAGVKLSAPVLVPFLLAVFITLVSAPFAIWLYGKGVPRGVAAAITFLLLLAGLMGLGFLVGGSINAFYESLPEYREELALYAERFRTQLEPLGADISGSGVGADSVVSGSVLEAIAAMLRSLADVVRILLLVLLIVLFMLFEAPGWQQKLDRMVDDEAQFQRLVQSTHELNTYLAVKSLTSFTTGALVTVMLYLCDVNLPLLWGLLAFLLNYIPSIGSIIASVPGIVLAMLDHGTGTAIGVGIGYLAINLAIGNGIEPRIMGQALGLSPLVVMLSVVFWGWLLGGVGAFLSVPLTMIVKILFQNTEDLSWFSVLLGPSPAPAPGTEPRLSRASIPPPTLGALGATDPADSTAGPTR